MARFVDLALERLRGRWVIIGGAVLPLVGLEQRVTLDINVAGPPEATMDDALTLVEIARDIGLPVEAINQAGAYFLRKIEDYESLLLPVAEGEGVTLLRPDPTLFVLLKLARLSETDLQDCLAYLDLCRRRGEPVDTPRLQSAIAEAIGDASPSRGRRLESLARWLEETRAL